MKKLILLFAFVFCISLVNAAWWAGQPSAYYKFDTALNATNVTDNSGNGLFLINNMNLNFTNGKLGNATILANTTSSNYQLNTSSGSSNFAFGVSPFTIAFWFNQSNKTAGSADVFIGTTATNKEKGWSITNLRNDGNYGLSFAYNGSAVIDGTGYSVEDSNWHRIVITRRGLGVNQTLYFIDGINVLNGTIAYSIDNSTSPLFIKNSFFDRGYLDELTIYNVSFSQNFVNLDYNSGIGRYADTAYNYPAYLCYQETANVSTQCGGLSTGNYRNDSDYGTSWYDGNWATNILLITPNNVTVNYTKPVNALDSSFFTYKDGSGTPTNKSIDSSCWNAFPDLSFRFAMNLTHESIYCRNSTGWKLMGYDTPNLLYEEAMWWNITLLQENSQTYNSSTSIGNKEGFQINVTYDNNYWSSVSSVLNYNGTNITGTKIGTGNNVLFSTTHYIPSISGTSAIVPFYWTILLSNSTTTVSYTSFNNTQTISSVALDDCSVYTNLILNFSLADEDTRNSINGLIELNGNFYPYGTSTNPIVSFNISANNTNTAKICFQNALGNSFYSLYYTAKYSATNYSTEYRYADNVLINNVTVPQQIKLYDLPISRATPFQIIVQDSNLNNLANAIIDIQRKYVALNQFLSVESPKTDSSGNTIASLVQNSETYNFLVYQNGQLLGEFDNYLVKCANSLTGDCSIRLNLISATNLGGSDYNNYGGLNYFFLRDATTNTIQISYSTVDNAIHNVTMKIVAADSFGNNTICSNTALASSGVLSCPNIASLYSNSTLNVNVYIDNLYLGTTSTSFNQNPQEIFGNTRVIIALLMFSTLPLIMIGEPIMMVIGSVIGMGLSIFMFAIDNNGSVLTLNNSLIIIYVVLSAIIIWRLAHRR